MQELLLGSWGAELIAYSQQNPVRVATAVLSVSSIMLTLMFGKRSSSGDGGDFSGFDLGGDDSGCGD